MSEPASQLKPASESAQRPRVLLITGMSGAGKSTALKVLEDLGYEAVDNLPLSLISGLVHPVRNSEQPLAIGIDIRTRDFGAGAFLAGIDELLTSEEVDARILFLDCTDDVLIRRYTETRRRHPLATDRPVADGIRHERRVVQALRERADLVIDTSSLKLWDLKRILGGHYERDKSPGIALFVTSFSYRHGLPPEADIVFDARFLVNPHYEPELKDLTGEDEDVGAFIQRDPAFAPFEHAIREMLDALLPRFDAEGKSYLTIAIGCTGGQHRSVFTAERLAEWLRDRGESVSLRHREISKEPGQNVADGGSK